MNLTASCAASRPCIGDILLAYAVLGVGLLFFVSRSNRTTLIGAAIAFAGGIFLLVAAVLSASNGPSTGIVADPAALDTALRGGFVDAAIGRLDALPSVFATLVVLNWFPAFGMFLLGLVAGRRGVLAQPQAHTRLWRGLLVVAAVIGLPGGIAAGLLAHGPGLHTAAGDVLDVAIGFGTAPALAGGYVALVALGTRRRWMRLVEPAGRMSLTGYLGESILLAAIFCGWGRGLFGRLGAFPAALVALGCWAGLELFSHLWLRRYTYGPFEWLLRCWSYGTIVALRPPARIPPAPPAGRSCSPADDQARVVVDTSRHGPQRHGWERP